MPGRGRWPKAYWSDPAGGGLDDYLRLCLPLYNPTPQPAEGLRRTLLDADILNSWSGEPLRRLDLLPGLANVRCPVLVIGGEEDPVTPIEDQRDIAAALPAGLAEFHAFAGAGHGVWRDRPADALALLRRFIEEDRRHD